MGGRPWVSDPHAGSRAHVAGLIAVVPRPQSKKGRGGWVKRTSILMVGMDIQFLPEIKHDNIFTKSKVGNWKISLHKVIPWAGRVIDYLRSNMITSYKVKSGDWKIGEPMVCHKLYPFGYCLKLQLSIRLEIVSVSQQTDE